MEIKFTRKQYKNLIKLVYLGNWIINAIRSGTKDNPQIKKYNEIEQYVFSFAKEARLEKYIEYDKEFKKFFPTSGLEEDPDIEKYRQDYEDEIFWEDLADKLGARDFIKEYGEKAIRKMTQKDKFLREQEFIIKYEEEFNKNRIQNLELLEKIDEIL